MSADAIDSRRNRSYAHRDLFGVGVLALGARLLYMVLVIPDYLPDSDAKQYELLAKSVTRGGGLAIAFPFTFLHASAFRPPLYPALLGGVWAVTGTSVFAGQILNVVLGCTAVVLAAVLAGRVGGRQAAIATGVVASLFPPLIANDTTLLSEPLSLVILLSVVLLLVDRRIEWAALASGLLMLTRPSAQAFAVVLTLWIVWRLGWRDALRFAALALLVVAPWVVRNWLTVGEPTLVTSNGFNLAAVYSSQATHAGDFVDPVFDSRFEQERYLHYSEGEWDKTLRDPRVGKREAAPVECDPRNPRQRQGLVRARTAAQHIARATRWPQHRLPQRDDLPLLPCHCWGSHGSASDVSVADLGTAAYLRGVLHRVLGGHYCATAASGAV